MTESAISEGMRGHPMLEMCVSPPQTDRGDKRRSADEIDNEQVKQARDHSISLRTIKPNGIR